MIQFLREKVQGWISMVIIGLLTIPFAFFGINSYLGLSAGHDAVAIVNGVSISNQYFQEVQQQNPSITLQDLIDGELWRQAMEDDHFFPVVDGFTGQVVAAKTQVVSALRNSAFILPHELSSLFSTRTVSYFYLPMPELAENLSSISEAELQSYYQKHQAEFVTPAQNKLMYILLPSSRSEQTQFKEDQLAYGSDLDALAKPFGLHVEQMSLSTGTALTKEQQTIADNSEVKKQLIASGAKRSHYVAIPDLGGLVFTVQFFPAQEQKFSEVKSRIAAVIQREKSNQAFLAQVNNELKTMPSLQAVAKQHSVVVQSKTLSQKPGVSDDLTNAAFGIKALNDTLAVPLQDSSKILVLELTGMTQPTEKELAFDAKDPRVKEAIDNDVKTTLDDYLISLRSHAKIKNFQQPSA